MEPLPRIPQNRIAVVIGKGGATRRRLEELSGAKRIEVNSETGEATVYWGQAGDFDPVKIMKLPEVVKAIARGMSPEKAFKLMEDGVFFQLISLKDFVGKNSNQQRRIRGRLIGTNGRIRQLIEEHSGCELSVFGSTVAIVGGEEGLAMAVDAVERLLAGAEHSSVLAGLESARRKRRLGEREMHYDEEIPVDEFSSLMPGLEAAKERRERRLRASQIDADDPEAVEEALRMVEDESVEWTEEE